MKRITALLGFVCLFVLFSCKKDVETPTADFSKSATNSLAVTTVNGVQVNTDTIPPTNAVDVKTYGAKGDGVTDDTKAIQNAINAQSVLVFKAGTYIINSTLLMRSGVKIYGTGGAAIKPGNAMSGTLLSLGRCIYIYANYQSQITNMVFLQSNQAYNLGVFGNACIYIRDSQNTVLTYNKFNYHQPYQHIGIEAIFVDGMKTLNTFIYKNICNTAGIEYAENGASGTICSTNTVNNSHSNALNGEGNGTQYCTKIQVVNNIINNAGYNGINDYGLIDGTLIKGNLITGTGKSPTEWAMGEGIQAVAVNTIVSCNTIIDAQAEYIECATNNKLIDSNKIIDYNFKAEGIVVNTTPNNFQSAARRTTTIIDHNNITGCLDAIEIFGAYTPSVTIKNNTINNPKSSGVNIIASASSYSLTVSNNTFNFTKPSLGVRKAVVTSTSNKTNTQFVAFNTNTFNYATSANGGAGKEVAFATTTNNVTLNGNTVNGNGIKSASGAEIVAMDNAGLTYTGYAFINNKFYNCLYWLTGFLTTSKTGNNF